MFGAALAILQVVHVELILEVVDVSVLLNVSAIEAFKFRLEALIFFLELGLDVLDTLEALVGAFELDSASLDRILEDSLVTSQ